MGNRSKAGSSLFSTRVVAVLAIPVLFTLLSSADDAAAPADKVTEENFVQVLTGGKEITPLLLDLLDYNHDGTLGSGDLLKYLQDSAETPPSVRFAAGSQTVNEGAGAAAVVGLQFNKPYTGKLKMSVEESPIIDTYAPGETPPRRISAKYGTDYTLTGPGIQTGTASGGSIPFTLTLQNAQTAEIVVTPKDDTGFENIERVILWIEPGDSLTVGQANAYLRDVPYNSTVYIDDNDGEWSGSLIEDALSGQTTPLPVDFDMKFTQSSGSYASGSIPLFAGSVPAGPPAVSFTGSSATVFKATFQIPLAADDTRFQQALSRKFILTANAGVSTNTVKPMQTFSGTYQETLGTAVGGTPAFGGVPAKTGIFFLSRKPLEPDNSLVTRLELSVQGQGTVSANPAKPYLKGDAVTLTAAPSAGWKFAAWDCSTAPDSDLTANKNPAAIVMTEDKTITAVFAKQ